MIHVLIAEPGGTVRTEPTDFITASRIVRSAQLRGVAAMIVPWLKADTLLWQQKLAASPPQAVIMSVAIEDGTCLCKLRPSGQSIKCLVPYGVEVRLPDGTPIIFEHEAEPTFPQGTPPNAAAGSSQPAPQPAPEAGDA